MSGIPSVEGVQVFLENLQRMSEAAFEINRLEVEIQVRVEQLNLQRGEFDKANKAMNDSMKNMDVYSAGNYGFQARAKWFFVELYRQLVAAPKEQISVDSAAQRFPDLGHGG